MKQGMSNVDVAALAAELAPLLVGARVEKAYQVQKEQVLFRLRRKGVGRLDLLFDLGRFLTVIRKPVATPERPSMFAQVLRSTFENARVVGFRQVGFDRLVRMDLERGDGRKAVVFELFGDGNLLVLDADDVIALPMKGADLGARRLRKGEPYLPPPGGDKLPFAMDATQLREGAAGQRDVVRYLATVLGFGPLWAEELCLRADVPKATKADAATTGQWAALHAAIASLGRDIARNDLAPAVVHEEGKAVDAVPFVLQKYPSPRFTHEEAPTFREALESFFVAAPGEEEGEADDDPRRTRMDEALAKVQRQVDQVDPAIAQFRAEEAERQADGEALYQSFQDVQSILASLAAARKDKGWAEVEEALRKGREANHPAALKVPVLRPHEGTALLALHGSDGKPRDVEVDLRLSVQENAEAHYAAAKKARSRREGAESARRDALARMKAIEEAGLDAFGAAPQAVERTSRHFWFESYRWTLTPSGLVAVGGRNAAQNDAVVKKYLRDGDRYVHADIHGAPSIVVRPAEGAPLDVPEPDLAVAGQFAVCASRAWRQFGHASAYWVTAAQVSKTPRSGEFVPRGAWIVHGKRNALEGLAMDWWVGRARLLTDGRPVPAGADPAAGANPATAGTGPRVIEKLVGGPKAGLAPWCTDLVHLVPGETDPNDAAAELADWFGTTAEEAQGVLPAGSVRFPDGFPRRSGGAGVPATRREDAA